jgi:hypothetical protein
MGTEKKVVLAMGSMVAEMVERRTAERTEILLACERVKAVAKRVGSHTATNDDIELLELFATAVEQYLK